MAHNIETNGMDVSVSIQIIDLDAAFNEISLRMEREIQIIAGLSDTYYDGFGQAFDSLRHSPADSADYEKNYPRYQTMASRHAMTLDILKEHQVITRNMLNALHLAYFDVVNAREKGAP